jgi:hypothetical protein
MKRENKLLETDWSEYRKMEKLCYVNSSYSTIKEIKAAEKYMIRKAYRYMFEDSLGEGKLDVRSLYNYLSQTRIWRTSKRIIPKRARLLIRNIISKMVKSG